MQPIIVSPARYASSRFPGKPLEPLAGCRGEKKTLIRRTWEAARAVRGVGRVVVATDDIRIRDEAESFGAEAILTSPACQNGTERCAEAAEMLGASKSLVINVQGDAPLTPPEFVEKLIDAMEHETDAHVATPVFRCSGRRLARMRKGRKNGRAGATTVVFDESMRALYFSKEIIPWMGRPYGADERTPVYYHVGVYAYTAEALKWYSSRGASKLETVEGLEQMRFLESDVAVACVEVDPGGRDFWELNNPEDVAAIEKILQAEGIA